jgi:DNA topoisomerase-1
VGKEIDSALMSTVARAFVLGGCPVCKAGELRMIRSKTTKKRFVGCSNYPKCKASSPLPQRGTVRTTPRACEHCAWPVVLVVGSGRPWRLCVNPSCPGRREP